MHEHFSVLVRPSPMIVTQQLKTCGIKLSLLPGVNHLREAASQPVVAGRGLAGSSHHWDIYTNMELILNKLG